MEEFKHGFDEDNLTPAMQQYAAVKKKYPDCVVLFRMGDFYETFYDDAKTCAKELEITLTSRGKAEKKAPLAGIPFHALDQYLAKLIKKGYKVAIVEQMEDPKKAKGIVKRDVVRIVTPGTVIEPNLLDSKKNNYIISLYSQGEDWGVASIDISTGEFTVFAAKDNQIIADLLQMSPAECVIPASLGVHKELHSTLKRIGASIQAYPDIYFSLGDSRKILQEHFKINSLACFGIDSILTIIQACGGLMQYLNETQKCSLAHITKIKLVTQSEHMFLESATVRNLELFSNIKDNNTYGSLLWVIDKTKTSMGARLLKKWMLYPLLSKEKIEERLDAVDELVVKPSIRQQLSEGLKQIQDIERIVCKVTYSTALPKDLMSLSQSISAIPKISTALSIAKADLLSSFNKINHCQNVVELLGKSLSSDPPFSIREGNIFAKGYNSELDKLREATTEGKTWIAALEQKEKERTGIKNLRIGYNKVFGYFILLSKGQMQNAPSDYIRKQTLATGERYVTPELKEKEELILHAEEKINELEYNLYMELLSQLQKEITPMQELALEIAKLDVLLSFAESAREYRYVKPEIIANGEMILEDARHPVVERLETKYVPNSIALSKEDRTMILTGPNMSGKSTFMRSIAHIQLMAQIGCYVPCSKAKISICDRIFTRIGAHDDLTHGQSTFMVEMNETANILHNATQNSLVVMDELGRGTSTFDGIALAYAVATYLHDTLKTKTLFATHYHQLNELSEKLKGIRNYHMSIKESGEDIVFLWKLIEGGTDKSYGIHAAKLAGVPLPVLDKAKDMMELLELEDEIAERIEANTRQRKKNDFNQNNTANQDTAKKEGITTLKLFFNDK